MTSAVGLSHYILALEQSSRETRQAEDRPLYQALLADAAGLLALALSEAGEQPISDRLSQHDRLWSQTWLRDPVFQAAATAWASANASLRGRVT